MKSLFYIFLLLNFSYLAIAEEIKPSLDYKIDGKLRSYTLGAAVVGEVGYAIPFWKNNKNKLFYGFVRPAVEIQTSLVVNYVSLKFDFNPISFLNFYSGYKTGYRDLEKLSSFDCLQVDCSGKIERKYVGLKFPLKYKDFFFLADIKFEQSHMLKSSNLYAEEVSGLIANPGRDQLNSQTIFLGKKLNDKFDVGAFVVLNQMQKNKNYSEMPLAFLRLNKDKWKYIVAAGYFEKITDAKHLTIVFNITWNGKNGIKLF